MGTELLPDSEKECWCLTSRDSDRSRDGSLDPMADVVNAWEVWNASENADNEVKQHARSSSRAALLMRQNS